MSPEVSLKSGSVRNAGYGLALGYEDLDDHDRLRVDPLLAIAVGKTDPTGEHRRSAGDRGKALAGKSTLNRLELSSEKDDRYRRTPASVDRIREALVNTFIRITEMKEGVPKRIILDIDATDDIIHGEQEGKFFHAYYNNYCYLLSTARGGYPPPVARGWVPLSHYLIPPSPVSPGEVNSPFLSFCL